MEWISIIGFIIFGIILIIVEIIFVPGTTIVGIGGFAIGCYGIFLSYTHFGSTTGNITAVISVLIGIIAIVVSFKTKMWEKFSLNQTMDGKNNDDFTINLQVGDEGVTISALRPIGKANFNENEVEVSSLVGFINENTKIKIVKIDHRKIFVEQLN